MNKFGQYAKAIAFAKLPLWVKNYNSQNRAKKLLQNHIRAPVCKKRALKNTHIIRTKVFNPKG